MPVFGHDIRDTIGTNGEAGVENAMDKRMAEGGGFEPPIQR